MTISFTGGGVNNFYAVYQATGYDTSTPVGATGSSSTNAGGNVNSLSYSLSGAPASDSYIISGVETQTGNDVSTGVSAGSSWTLDTASNIQINSWTGGVEHITGTTSTTVSWTDVAVADHAYTLSAFALEIRAAPTSGPTPADCSMVFQPNALLTNPRTLDTNQLHRYDVAPAETKVGNPQLDTGPFNPGSLGVGTLGALIPGDGISGPTTPADCSMVFIPSANLVHPRTIDTNQPLNDTFSGWTGAAATPTQLGFWFQPPFLGPVPKSTQNTNQAFFNSPQEPKTPTALGFFTQAPDLEHHVPTIYTAQTFQCNPTLGPPVPGWYTQPPDLLNHPRTVDTNQPLNDTFAGWNKNLTPSSLGFWQQPQDLLRHPGTIDTNQPVGELFSGWNTPTLVLSQPDKGAPLTWTGATSLSSNTFTPESNSLLIVVLGTYTHFASTPSFASTTISGGGLTWTPFINVTNTSSGTTDYFATLAWYAPVTVGSSMSLSITGLPAGSTFAAAQIQAFCVQPYNTATPIGATGTNATNPTLGSGAVSVTLNTAPAASSIVFGCNAFNPVGAGGTSTAGSGYAKFYDAVDTSGDVEVAGEYITGQTSTTVPWAALCVGNTVKTSALIAFEVLAPGGATPADCSFLFQPNALLTHPRTLDTNQPLDDAFFGWAGNTVTPTALGFWNQAPALLRHQPTIDTNQAFVFNPPPGGQTPADCSFLYQPNALLHHPATVDTNQALDDAFAGWAQNQTPTTLGFWTQAPDLLRHAPTLDTNQPLNDAFAGWTGTAATPTAFGFWTQPPDLLKHPGSLDTNQPKDNMFSGWTQNLTPTSFGFFTQAPDLLHHPQTVDTNQPLNDAFAGWTGSAATPTSLGFFVQAPDLLRHPVTLDTRQPFEFNPPPGAVTPADCAFLFQPSALLRHPATIDTNQPLNDTFVGWTAGKLTPTAFGFWFQPSALLRHPPHLDTNQPRLVSQVGATPTSFGWWGQPRDLLRHPVPFILGMQPFIQNPPVIVVTTNRLIKVYFFD